MQGAAHWHLAAQPVLQAAADAQEKDVQLLKEWKLEPLPSERLCVRT